TAVAVDAPDLASLAGSIPQGQLSLVIGVSAAIADPVAPGGFVPSGHNGLPPLGFDLPDITSLSASTTGQNHGSINGGYEVTVSGTELIGVTTVQFFLGDDRIKTVPIDESEDDSDTSLDFNAPDLSTLIASIPK